MVYGVYTVRNTASTFTFSLFHSLPLSLLLSTFLLSLSLSPSFSHISAPFSLYYHSLPLARFRALENN